MKNNVAIIKILENEYRVSGTVLYLKDVSKSVTVDGETYWSKKLEEAEIDLDKEWAAAKGSFKWHCYETDFLHYFKMNEIKVWDYSNSYYFVSQTIFSNNDYVGRMETLSELGILPIEIHKGKGRCKGWDIGDAKRNRDIEMTLFSYGFGNIVTTYVKYSDVLKYSIPINILNISYCLDSLFPKDYHLFDDFKKSELLVNFINIQQT
jgi:hypothetical protein